MVCALCSRPVTAFAGELTPRRDPSAHPKTPHWDTPNLTLREAGLARWQVGKAALSEGSFQMDFQSLNSDL